MCIFPVCYVLQYEYTSNIKSCSSVLSVLSFCNSVLHNASFYFVSFSMFPMSTLIRPVPSEWPFYCHLVVDGFLPLSWLGRLPSSTKHFVWKEDTSVSKNYLRFENIDEPVYRHSKRVYIHTNMNGFTVIIIHLLYFIIHLQTSYPLIFNRIRKNSPLNRYLEKIRRWVLKRKIREPDSFIVLMYNVLKNIFINEILPGPLRCQESFYTRYWTDVFISNRVVINIVML